MKHYLNINKVMVSINYRLGVLGFFTSYDEILPGNIGFWDQKMALEWVQENAAAFGGDPKQVKLN